MTILFSKEILSVINNELKNATESVQIISAYCKMDAFKTIKFVFEVIPSIVLIFHLKLQKKEL